MFYSASRAQHRGRRRSDHHLQWRYPGRLLKSRRARPVVRRVLDPNYLPGDFGISLRYYHHHVFVLLVAWFSALFGEDNALIILNLIGKCFLSAALYYLCRALNLSLTAFLIAGLLIAINAGWAGLGFELNDFVLPG